MRIGGVEIPGRVFLAPLAAYTSWPLRRICRRLGAGLVWTEVVKARELVRGVTATFEIVRFKEDEHPISAQILSADPGEAREAAAILSEMGFDFVDLNCGCPKRRVMSDGMGGELMGSPERIGEIVAGMCQGAAVPVTVKIRAGLCKDEPTAVEAAQRAEASGAAGVCVHPRYAHQAASRPPDWGLIGQVKKSVAIPVTGNGGIHAAGDVVRMFEATGCDAAAVGRAAMGAPWIFRQATWLLETGEGCPGPTQEEILGIVLEHYRGLVEHHGERGGTIMMRKQSCHYARHLHNGRAFNEAVIQASTTGEFMAAVDLWLRKAHRGEAAVWGSRFGGCSDGRRH